MNTVQASYDDPRVEYDSLICTYDGLLEVIGEDESRTVIKKRTPKKTLTVFKGTLTGTAVYEFSLDRILLGTVLYLNNFELLLLGTVRRFITEIKELSGSKKFESTKEFSLFGIKRIFTGVSFQFEGTKKIFSDTKSLLFGTKVIKNTDTRCDVIKGTKIFELTKKHGLFGIKKIPKSEQSIVLSGTKKVNKESKFLVTGEKSLLHILDILDLF